MSHHYQTQSDLEYSSQFQRLMRKRVQNILLISSHYDSFTMEEDGGLADQIEANIFEMSLAHAPDIIRVPNIQRAISFLKDARVVDMVVCIQQVNDPEICEGLNFIQENFPKVYVFPIFMSLIGPTECLHSCHHSPLFLWNGDTVIFLTLMKLVEDLLNIDEDRTLGVGVILYVEDSPHHYSTILPIVFQELINLCTRVLPHDINTMHYLRRKRSRPKVLFAACYEDAIELVNKYRSSLIGVISDIIMPVEGKMAEGGFKLHDVVGHSIPFLYLSTEEDAAEKAALKNACFIRKDGPSFRKQLRAFINNNLGFGDFIFRVKNSQKILHRARDLVEFINLLPSIPAPSIEFHFGSDHFSQWFFIRGEFTLAYVIRQFRLQNPNAKPDEIIQFLTKSIRKHNKEQGRGQLSEIMSINTTLLKKLPIFVKHGHGSLGGKGRGLVFLDRIITSSELHDKFPDISIRAARSLFLSTSVFRQFLIDNKLDEYCDPDCDKYSNTEIADKFCSCTLPETVLKSLQLYLTFCHSPLAVRSSSLLEDSRRRPLAGIYETYMVTNSSRLKMEERLEQLKQAVKLVFASTYFGKARKYLRSVNVNLAHEAMGVIVQEVIGTMHDGDRFYPEISGVAQSINYYPLKDMPPEDGIATLALGLGKMIVDKGVGIKFGLTRPQASYLFSTDDYLKNTQKSFYSIDMTKCDTMPFPDEMFDLGEFGLDIAEKDQSLLSVGSVYSIDDQRIWDDVCGDPERNIRLVTMRNVLNGNQFPLAEILSTICKLAEEGVGSPVEIEFAINLPPPGNKDKNILPEFVALQLRPMMRPLSLSMSDDPLHNVQIDLKNLAENPDLVVYSTMTLGHGVVDSLNDIVYIKKDTWNPLKTHIMRNEIDAFNSKLGASNTPYIAICIGRWGTSEPSLGIPVDYHQISGAKTLIETEIPGFQVEPSFGTHFIHNVMAFMTPFLHTTMRSDSFFNWEFLDKQEIIEDGQYVRHIRCSCPLTVTVNGWQRVGIIRQVPQDQQHHFRDRRNSQQHYRTFSGPDSVNIHTPDVVLGDPE